MQMDMTRNLTSVCVQPYTTVYGRHFDGMIRGLPSRNRPVDRIP